MWDPVISRWLVVDPQRQFASPYVGMGNNAINQVDPDGEFSRFGAWWRSKLMPNSWTYQVGESGKEWAIGWAKWREDDQGAYLRFYSITEGGPGLGKDFMTFDGVINLGLTGTASAGFGFSFELGVAIEHKPELFKIRPYFTLEQTWGADLSGGGILNYHKPNEGTLSISDIEGWGETWNGGIWIFDGTYGGNSLNPGLNPVDYSDKHNKYHTYGFGISAGTPIGFTKNKGHTWTYFND